ncbi:hypothetical protein HN51_048810 [Arachis hypogaea]|uniref:DUF4378 domain-containing protein n=1 Tax=Arachis hypogaea TaxID=3818 RepID=A0A445E8S9_ARAHY|nr:uncharacterized protein LOC107626072 [Arachis ipaensis]XP_025634341.1 uncharacterized protein LOC112728431 [Arachis hypogaea]QHO25433.1 uncharacterized protein DS421_12g381050 [Arachis hypogaea]RYR71861.1 hypothetical protein Ahy_A02g006072 [Arachis hypogaea]
MSGEMQLKRFNTMERRPLRTLRDLLSENNNNSYYYCSNSSSSCSSSGFKSLPRRINQTNKSSMQTQMKNPSTFQTLINTFKTILVKKSPSMILPRSISRKLSSSRRSSRLRNQTFCKGSTDEVEISTVKIKDIIRWRSFKDVTVEEEHNNKYPLSQSQPLDFHRCMMMGSTTTTTTTTTTTCSSSNGSSWNESDFTSIASGYSSSWEPQNDDVLISEKFPLSPLDVVVGKDLVQQKTNMAGPKEISSFQEDEQHSPISVLQIGKDEFPHYNQSLADIERRKQKVMDTFQIIESLAKFDLPNLDQYIILDENFSYNEDCDNYDCEVEEQDYVEQRAMKLLNCVKATCSFQSYDFDTLLLDFFKEELSKNIDDEECESESEMLRIAKEWVKGSFGYDIGHVNNYVCIKDMDKRGEWSKFEKEKEEMVLEIEKEILHSLVAELLDLHD